MPNPGTAAESHGWAKYGSPEIGILTIGDSELRPVLLESSIVQCHREEKVTRPPNSIANTAFFKLTFLTGFLRQRHVSYSNICIIVKLHFLVNKVRNFRNIPRFKVTFLRQRQVSYSDTCIIVV